MDSFSFTILYVGIDIPTPQLHMLVLSVLHMVESIEGGVDYSGIMSIRMQMKSVHWLKLYRGKFNADTDLKLMEIRSCCLI
jgi:hypothetical protein